MRITAKKIFSICLCLAMAAVLLAGCGETSNAPTNFKLDMTDGTFSFTGVDNADYYVVWVYAVDAEGVEAESYSAASARITGTGDLNGKVDLSSLPFGSYNAKLITFVPSGEKAPDPVVEQITVTGKLSTPEFKAAWDGENVTITVYSETVKTWCTSEMFTDIDINIRDAGGSVVATETITEDDLTITQGFGTSYSCTKTFTLPEGGYQISLTAKGDGEIAQASDESEKVSLSIAAGTPSEVQTSGYVESTGGFPGGFPGGGFPGGPG